MALFAVISPSANPKLATHVAKQFGPDSYELAPGQWIVSSSHRTAQQISMMLGIGDDPEIRAFVCSIGSYWGRHNRDLWEWIKVKLETQNG